MSARNLLLLAAMLAGISYLASGGLALSPAAAIGWKGAGVGLLAVYAATRARDADGWLLAAVMALGAAGDVLLEVVGLTRGALAFLAGHIVAVVLYARNLRPGLRSADWLAAGLLIAATVAVAWSLPADRAGAPGVAFYALGLSAMAAAAWLSRFPRDRAALGALMFLVSDLLIFARAGPLHGVAWVSEAVWILYFSGQTLICLGVSDTLAAARRAHVAAAL